MALRTITRGVEWEISWRFKTDTVTPKNLTGYKVLVQLRPHDKSDVVIKEWTELSDELTFVPLNGMVTLFMKPSTTIAYDFKSAVLDCWVHNDLIDTDGDRSPLENITIDWGSSRP
jgi:hypothetical protein